MTMCYRDIFETGEYFEKTYVETTSCDNEGRDWGIGKCRIGS